MNYNFTVTTFNVFHQAIVLPGFVLSCELFPASDRTVAGRFLQHYGDSAKDCINLLSVIFLRPKMVRNCLGNCMGRSKTLNRK